MPTVNIGRLRGGYCVYWTDASGRRRRYQLSACTREEAESEARDVFLRESSSGQGARVTDLWEAYRSELDGRPMATHMVATGKHVLPHFGHLRPDQISVEDCRTYVATKRERLGDGTIWTQLGHLRTVMSWAVKRRLIEHAPHIERPSQPAPRERRLINTEITRLLATPCEPHIRLAVILMLTTAARVRAVLELTWDRVDFDRGLIHLRRPDFTTRKGRATPPMNDSARGALLAAREAALTPYVIEWAGKPVGSIKKGFAALVKRAGLDDVSPHVLRHTAACRMAEAGVPMDEIAQYLGHSSTRITAQVYARYSPDHLRKAARALELPGGSQVQ